jgi:hypothetical protein
MNRTTKVDSAMGTTGLTDRPSRANLVGRSAASEALYHPSAAEREADARPSHANLVGRSAASEAF